MQTKQAPFELLILTEGGVGSGMGHISRCTSLYQAWEEVYSAPWLICDGGPEITLALANLQAQRLAWRQQPDLLEPWLAKRPFVLIDSYHLSQATYTYLALHSRAVLYLDDLQNFKYPGVHYLNGALFAERLPYPQGCHLLGSPYLPLRTAFWSAGTKPIKAQVERLFISFGGDDPQGLTMRLLPVLLEYYTEWQFEVVIGPFFRDRKRLLQKSHPNIKYLISPDAESIAAAMSNCDLAVSAAGQTLYELAAWGVPTLAIQTADNQRANLEAWKEVGLVRSLESCDTGLETRLNTALKTINLNWRKQAAAAGRQHVDGQGARRVIDWIRNRS